MTDDDKSRANKVLNTPAFSWDWPKVGLFIPMGRNIPSSCAVSMIQLQMHNLLPMASIGRHCLLDKTRTMAATAFLKSDLDALLFLDDDHIHDKQLPGRLAYWMALYRNEPEPVHVVGGMNFRRFGNHAPCVFVDQDGHERWDGQDKPTGLGVPTSWEPGTLMPCAILGTGSMLIHRSVFERIEYPYFVAPTDWVRTTDDEDSWPGEDIGFAQRCRRAGIQQYCDPGCVSPHLSEFFADESHYQRPDEATEYQLGEGRG